MADSVSSFCPANLQIPVDLFASKKHPDLVAPGDLGFADSTGNLVYVVRKSSSTQKSLLDSSGNVVVTIHRLPNGTWEGFKGNGVTQKELILKMNRTLNKFTRSELEAHLISNNGGESEIPVLKIKGCPFMKSCTISSGDSIIAQTSLMYKLNQIYVRRNRFRLTFLPGSIDHFLIIATVIVFLEARK